MRNAFRNALSIVAASIILSVRRFKYWRAERKAFWSPETLAWYEQQQRKHENRPKPGKGRR